MHRKNGLRTKVTKNQQNYSLQPCGIIKRSQISFKNQEFRKKNEAHKLV